MLAPEIAAAPLAFYSFRDLLALRTFVHLREHASLQRIRAAIGNLRDLGEVAHLASYRLVSDAAGNIQRISEYYPGVTAEAARDALNFADYVDRYSPPARAA